MLSEFSTTIMISGVKNNPLLYSLYNEDRHPPAAVVNPVFNPRKPGSLSNILVF